jgi:ribosomal protein S7|tara:strand:- start:1174 stop:1608 length:435 start_codon:yes stop_codon:yes gene_type:complete
MIKQKTLKQNISNRIMVNGNKRTSEKVLFKTLKSIQKSQAKKNFETILKTSLINSSPLLYVKQIKRKRKRTVEFPFLLNSKLKMSYAIKFLVLNSKKKKAESFYKSFNSELLNSSKKTSLSFKQKLDLHKDGFTKRKFANYRWF